MSSQHGRDHSSGCCSFGSSILLGLDDDSTCDERTELLRLRHQRNISARKWQDGKKGKEKLTSDNRARSSTCDSQQTASLIPLVALAEFTGVVEQQGKATTYQTGKPGEQGTRP